MSSGFAGWYQEGGWWMHLVSLLLLLAIPTGVLALSLRRKPVALAALALGVLTVAVGAGGYLFGMNEVERAVATIEPAHREEAHQRGEQIARRPLTYGGYASIPAFAGGLIGLLLARRRGSA